MTPRRVTISIPEDVARIVERMENVSAFFTDAARKADRRRRLADMLDKAAKGDRDALKRARIRARMRAQMAQADVRRLEQPRTAEEVSEIVVRLLSEQPEDVQREAAEQVWQRRRAA
jgi:hypothetical protein